MAQNYFNILPLRLQLEELGKCRFMQASEFEGVGRLKGKKIVIVGCGAQGLHQGLNLRDSGLDVAYALRDEAISGKRQSWKNATDNGFKVGNYQEMIPGADLVINLTPDKQHSKVVAAVMPLMKKGACLSYSHGFNIVEEGMRIREDLTVIMVAPKSPGTEVREEYRRKDKAVWDKGNGEKADKVLINVAAKSWIGATKDEKDRVFEYTHHYCNVNEPLQGRKYSNSQSKKDFEHRVNNITSYIDKNVLPTDMWFMRGDDGLGAIASRIQFAGGKMPSDLQGLVGMTMQEGGFMSTGSRKGVGFSHKSVIVNIYAPKGTRAAYIEPISNFGNGAGRDWDGKQRFSSFSSEHETLFQRGTKMRITRAYKVEGKTYIDCEVIGQEIKPLSYVKDSDIGY